MRPFVVTAASLLLTAFWACSGTGRDGAEQAATFPDAGKVHERIVCRSDTTLSYALYIPFSAAKGKHAARTVAILIDPHAAGALPVGLYQELAERYGWILLGSNDSKNGLSPETSGHIVAALAAEASGVYGADSSRLYLAGFSGGSRAATTAALYDVPVKGVIACGAGFGTAPKPPRYRFDFFGLAGRADFNMNELLALKQPLQQAGFRAMIITFPGKHAWPPLNRMQEAFRWQTLNAIRDGSVPENQALVAESDSAFHAMAAELELNKDYLAAAEVYSLALSSLEGLTSTTFYTDRLQRLTQSAEYIAQLESRTRRIATEESEKQERADDLQTKSPSWWKETVRRYKAHPTGADPEDTLMSTRILSFLSLYCYMNANSALNRREEAAAARYIEIYRIVDPENPEADYMQAVLMARQSNSEQAIAALNAAVKKGFRDYGRTEAQPEFKNLKATAGWDDLLKSMK